MSAMVKRLLSWFGGPRAPRLAPAGVPPAAAPERRAALRGIGAALLNVVALGALSRKAGSAEEAPKADASAADKKPQAPQRKWGMAIDLDKCTGCGGCSVACKVENNIPPVDPSRGDDLPSINWMELLTTTDGTYPDLSAETLPLPCMHCEDAPCVKVCPVGATFMTEDGINAQVWERCIGCRYCQAACPYSRRHFNWTAPSWPESLTSLLNPDVAVRPAGVVEKCTFCHHRVRSTFERARIDGEEVKDEQLQHLTACAQACPTKAITFGDLNDASSEVARLHKSPRATRLLEELGTKPKVVYLRNTKWRE